MYSVRNPYSGEKENHATPCNKLSVPIPSHRKKMKVGTNNVIITKPTPNNNSLGEHRLLDYVWISGTKILQFCLKT